MSDFAVLPSLLFAAGVICAAFGFWKSRKRQPLPANVTDDLVRLSAVSARDGLLIQDMKGRILWANPAYCDMLGRSFEGIKGLNPLSFALPEEHTPSPAEIEAFEFDPSNELFQRSQAGDVHLVQNIRSDGSLFWMQISIGFHESHHQKYAVLACRDVSEQVAREEKLKQLSADFERLAKFDPLTGCANRTELLAQLDTILTAGRKTGNCVGLMHVDLDKFKELNDCYGHAGGDAALVHVATQLKSKLRDNDLVSRIGGDEFVIVCSNVRCAEHLEQIGWDLVNAVRKPLEWDEKTLTCQISIGAVLTDCVNTNVDELLTTSDSALYEMKKHGRNGVALFDVDMRRRLKQHSDRSTALKEAVDKGDITFEFLPVIQLDTGEVRGFETLARWVHPTEGKLTADSFLNLARETNLISTIDLRAVDAACRMLARLHKTGISDKRVSTNICHSTLSLPDLIPQITEIAKRHGVDKNSIALEIDQEPADIERRRRQMFRAMAKLKDAGLYVILDNFGRDSADLTTSDALPYDALKLDPSITKGLSQSESKQRASAAMIGLACARDLCAVVQGIETQADADQVQAFKASRGSGHWYAKALSADDAVSWLVANDVRPPLRSTIAPAGAARYSKQNSP